MNISKEKFLDKYRGVKVTFASYYKYRFLYKATVDDVNIWVSFGDDFGDIYRNKFNAEEIIREYNLQDWGIIK